jgi:hypothetical protein
MEEDLDRAGIGVLCQVEAEPLEPPPVGAPRRDHVHDRDTARPALGDAREANRHARAGRVSAVAAGLHGQALPAPHEARGQLVAAEGSGPGHLAASGAEHAQIPVARRPEPHGDEPAGGRLRAQDVAPGRRGGEVPMAGPCDRGSGADGLAGLGGGRGESQGDEESAQKPARRALHVEDDPTPGRRFFASDPERFRGFRQARSQDPCR